MSSKENESFNARRYILRHIAFHRTRSGFTILGIAICVAFFILFTSIGVGLQEYIEDEQLDRTQADKEKLSKTAEIVDGWVIILTGVLIVILVASILNTMLMSVSQRKREIGVLKSLGISRKQIFNMVLMEAAILTTIAFLIGSLIGLVLAFGFDAGFQGGSSSGVLRFFAPTHVTPSILFFAVVMTLGFGTLAAFFPAYMASKLTPTEAIRYE